MVSKKVDSLLEEQMANQERLHRGIPTKVFVGLVASCLIIGIASAGLLSYFALIDITIDVDPSILINDEPAPYEGYFSFNGMAGNITSYIYNATNLRDDAIYILNFSVNADEGLNIRFLNDTLDEIQNITVNPLETVNFTVETEIDFLADPEQDLTAYITVEPEMVTRI